MLLVQISFGPLNRDRTVEKLLSSTGSSLSKDQRLHLEKLGRTHGSAQPGLHSQRVHSLRRHRQLEQLGAGTWDIEAEPNSGADLSSLSCSHPELQLAIRGHVQKQLMPCMGLCDSGVSRRAETR